MKVTAITGAITEGRGSQDFCFEIRKVCTHVLHTRLQTLDFSHTVREDSCSERMVKKVEMLSQQIQDQKQQANAQTITATQEISRNSQLP